jgi:hypothetical protein
MGLVVFFGMSSGEPNQFKTKTQKLNCHENKQHRQRQKRRNLKSQHLPGTNPKPTDRMLPGTNRKEKTGYSCRSKKSLLRF